MAFISGRVFGERQSWCPLAIAAGAMFGAEKIRGATPAILGDFDQDNHR
jgi:hypothetical protein